MLSHSNHGHKSSISPKISSRTPKTFSRTYNNLIFVFQVIDRLFDVMNSRNPRAKGFKAPLGLLNWKETLEFMTKAQLYLTKLMMNDGTPLHRSKRFFSIMNISFLLYP